MLGGLITFGLLGAMMIGEAKRRTYGQDERNAQKSLPTIERTDFYMDAQGKCRHVKTNEICFFGDTLKLDQVQLIGTKSGKYYRNYSLETIKVTDDKLASENSPYRYRHILWRDQILGKVVHRVALKEVDTRKIIYAFESRFNHYDYKFDYYKVYGEPREDRPYEYRITEEVKITKEEYDKYYLYPRGGYATDTFVYDFHPAFKEYRH